MKWLLCIVAALAAVVPVSAQRRLCLDSCRAMALRNNKQMAIAEKRVDAARDIRRSARTQYLPRVSAVGGYLHSNKEISLLSDAQKAALSSIGTTATAGIGADLQGFAANLTEAQAAALDALFEPFGMNAAEALAQFDGSVDALAGTLNAQGQAVADAFRTDTRNMYAGAVMFTQPLFLGGSIIAMNKMADVGEHMAADGADARRQSTLYDTDKAYWTIVSLRHKQRLAESYCELVCRLDSDMTKLVREGMATRSEALTVKVKVNEAEMTLAEVTDGLAMARMALCKLCGLPLNEDITLAEEDADSIAVDATSSTAEAFDEDNRPDLRMMRGALELSKQATNVLRSGNMPQLALVGGYTFSNPNVYNGFRNKFGGAWSVGVVVRIPVLNWGDVSYKVRASRSASAMAELELEEARQGVELQVSQGRYRVDQAAKRLVLAAASVAEAEANLRSATLGFREGVIGSSTVMEAQAAWLRARSQRIDAEIEVKLSQVALDRALGTL